VALSDPDLGRAEAAAEAAGARRIVADGLTLIDDPDVDAVLVASPDPTHADFVLACLARGKPVLCEKPLAPRAEDCLRVVRAELELGRRLVQVGFMRRFDPFYGHLKDTLDSGACGQPLLLHCVHRNVSAPDWFTSEMAVNNSAVHEVDIVRWLLAEEIEQVQVIRSVPKRGGLPRDPILLLLRMASGVVADVEVFIHAAYGYDIRMEAVCEEGTIDLGRPQPPSIRKALAVSDAFPADWRGRFGDAYRLQLQSWVRSLSGAPVGASAWDGYAATTVTDALVRSLQSGDAVSVTLEPRPDLYRN
jgi:myo-inositol 2-dehydrogenase/D-chiro-inositol 1-dehydrogenase